MIDSPRRTAFVSLAKVSSAVGACALLSVALQPMVTRNVEAQKLPTKKSSPASDKARRAKVYAKIGAKRITVGDIEDAIATQSPVARIRLRDPEKLKEFAQDMVQFELLANAAAKQGYQTNPAVQRAVGKNTVQQLLRKRFDERLTPESIPDADVKAYYDAHRSEYSRPELVRASHILVANEKDARDIIRKARGGDAATFRNLARQRSVDTETKLRGGDLRYFAEDGRPPGSRDAPVDEALVKAAFKLRTVGQVAPRPVAVGDNYSIVKLTGRRPAQEQTQEQAAQAIRLRLWRERRQTGVEDLVASLRKSLRPKVHPDRLKPIQLDPAPARPDLPPGDPNSIRASKAQQFRAKQPKSQ